MGKEESIGPVDLKDDDSEKEEIDDNTNTEVRLDFLKSPSSCLFSRRPNI